MRKCRVIAVVVASLVSSASIAQAQSAAPIVQDAPHQMRGEMHGEHGRGFGLRGITLSDAERARLKDVHRKYVPEEESLRTREQADIRAALSPENQKLFDANVEKRAERRAEHGRKDGHAGRRGANG